MQTYSQLKNTLDGAGLSDAERQHMINLLQHRSMNKDNTDRFDDAYMHCLLRPEEATSTRVPSEYGRQSCCLKQHTSFTLSTGANGEGMFAYLPQDFAFSSGMFITDTASSAEVAPGLTFAGGFSDNYKRLHPMTALMNDELSNNFQSARVVGASIVVRWIGDDDDETGQFVASHLYDYNVGLLDTDKIDNGHHALQHRPSKGLRMIYLPRSQQDFEFCSLDTRLSTSKSVGTLYGNPCYNYNPSEYARGGALTEDALSEKTLFLTQRGVTVADNIIARAGTPTWVPQPQTDQRIPLDYIGTGPKSAYMNNPMPQICAFYWKGMPANRNWMKVDIIRHLELVPRPFLREMVQLSRPIHDSESMKVAIKLASKDSKHVVASLDHSEQLRPLVTAGIATAQNNDSFLGMINHALWPPSWSGPVGDMARFVNRPQKELFHALTGMSDHDYLMKTIPIGIGAVAAAATGGSAALVPFAAGIAEQFAGKEITDFVMDYATGGQSQQQQQQQVANLNNNVVQNSKPYTTGRMPRQQLI